MKPVIINLKKVASQIYFPVLALIAINLCIGRLIVDDYGESWDEANNRIYAQQSLEAYKWWGDKTTDLEDHLGPTNQRYRGPAYPMLASLVVSQLQALNENWFSIDLWHWVNFLSFQLGIFFFYMLCIRYMGTWAAFGATLIFATQPLLWGHAFINSKDIPLLVFFLGSIALGLKMVDAFFAHRAPEPAMGKNFGRFILQDWVSTRGAFRKIFVFISSLLVVFLLASNVIQNLLVGIIIKSYQADPSSFLGRLFSGFAENSGNVPLDDYILRGVIYFHKGRIFCVLILIALLSVLSYHVFHNTLFVFRQHFLSQWYRRFSKWLYLLAASAMLGLAISTRVAGALAGGLIAIYNLTIARKKSIPVLVVYISAAIVVTYITWPYLWPNPVGHFIESLSMNSNFEWTGKVLFQGVEYRPYNLPARYLPVLLTLQFTEPVFFLFWIGFGLALIRIYQRTDHWEELLVILAWFAIPSLLLIVFCPVMYDNFRQCLFVVPPIFVMAGFALDTTFKQVRPRMLKLGILLILLLPGFYEGVKLHPYQYIYYSRFAGGVNGAYRQYELDYWATSYREATLYLNAEAPLNSKVLVVGPRRIFMSYAREDLNQEWFTVEELEETTDPVYVIISTRYNDDLTQFPDAEVVYRVSRDGGTLAVVKQIK